MRTSFATRSSPAAPLAPRRQRATPRCAALPPTIIADAVPALVEFEARLNPAVAVAAAVAAAPPIIFWARIALNARKKAAEAAAAEAAAAARAAERAELLDRLNGK